MLVIQGVFRSGTTTLFKALRQDDHFRCYYEPLHPDLLDHVNEAAARSPSHRKSPLFAEYTSIAESVRKQFRSDFALNYAILDATAEVPPLRRYLRLLIESAPAVVLQFNRAFWMTPWLHALASGSVFIQLVRDPRSVVWSQLTTRSGRVRMDWPLVGRKYVPFSSGNSERMFSPYAYHGAYHVRDYYELGRRSFTHQEGEAFTWARDRLEDAREAAPYVQALALWAAQTYLCHTQAEEAFGDQYLLLRYEDLCTSPGRALQQVYDAYDRPLPPSIQEFGTEQIHARRISPWKEMNEAEERFQRGIQKAGIGPLMEDLGYDA